MDELMKKIEQQSLELEKKELRDKALSKVLNMIINDEDCPEEILLGLNKSLNISIGFQERTLMRDKALLENINNILATKFNYTTKLC